MSETQPDKKELETRLEATNSLLTSCYHRYACEGERALDSLHQAKDVYETIMSEEAERLENQKAGEGTSFVFALDGVRKDHLLSIVSPERFNRRFDGADLYRTVLFGSAAVSLIIPEARYGILAYASLRYSEGKEENRRDHFADILNKYYLDCDSASLGFRAMLESKTTQEIGFIKDVIKPELDKRRKRILGRAMLTTVAGFSIGKSIGVL